MNIDFSKFNYYVPDDWYKGGYIDRNIPCDAGRSFSLTHESKPSECWLCVTGYRGYPGELVRPAYDLYLEGYDVFVPRLPGMGTTTYDFLKSDNSDWINLIVRAVKDLENRYEKVNLLGHSMGAAICSIVGNRNPKINKIIYAAPSFENLELPWYLRIYISLVSIFVKKVKAKWSQSNLHHHQYEGQPKDNEYLGEQYYKWHFPKHLLMYYQISRDGMFAMSKHDHLLICPLNDKNISIPSTKIFRKALKDDANVVEIENGTHLIFYDIDEAALENAVKAVLDFARK